MFGKLDVISASISVNQQFIAKWNYIISCRKGETEIVIRSKNMADADELADWFADNNKTGTRRVDQALMVR